jgi:hypothetical protein
MLINAPGRPAQNIQVSRLDGIFGTYTLYQAGRSERAGHLQGMVKAMLRPVVGHNRRP